MNKGNLFSKVSNRKENALRHASAAVFILTSFNVVPCDKPMLLAARALRFTDYEDAAMTVAAKKAKCAYIITRNTRDFANSPVPALTPGEFLAL